MVTRRLLLCATLILFPLSGCLANDANHSAFVEAIGFRATYRLGDGSIEEATLSGPVRIGDRDGFNRLAYVLEWMHEDWPQLQTKLYLDNHWRLVRYDLPCWRVVESKCVRHEVYWDSQGAPPGRGFFLSTFTHGESVNFEWAGYSWSARAHVEWSEGLRRIDIEGMPDIIPKANRLLDGIYEYDDATIAPVSFRIPSTNDLSVTTGVRLSYAETGPLGPADKWPIHGPAAATNARIGVLFPGENEAFFEWPETASELIDEARASSPTFSKALENGCLVEFVLDAPAEPSNGGLIPIKIGTSRDKVGEFTLSTTTGKGILTRWEFKAFEEDGGNRSFELVDEQQETYTRSCESVVSEPWPLVSAVDFARAIERMEVRAERPAWFGVGLSGRTHDDHLIGVGLLRYGYFLKPLDGVESQGGISQYEPYWIRYDPVQGWLTRLSLHPGDAQNFALRLAEPD